MIIRLTILLIVTVLLPPELAAQDLHYSQFSQAAQQLNPSLNGVMPCDLRVYSFARRQWASVTIPYRTFTAGAAMKLDALSAKLSGFSSGFVAAYDDAGDGRLRTLDLKLALAYAFPLSSDSSHRLHIGLNGGIAQRSIDFGRLTFDNQFNGDNFIAGAPNGETFSRNSATWSDLGIGVAWSRHQTTGDIIIGISAQHLNRPEQQFMDEIEKRPLLWQAGGYGRLETATDLELLPALQLLVQREFSELMAGVEMKKIFEQGVTGQSAIGFGIWYRSSDAIAPSFAYYKNKFRYGISYDINISSLTKASRGAGGPEFCIVYQWSKIKPQLNPKGVCPVY